jgi:hypothetical protein
LIRKYLLIYLLRWTACCLPPPEETYVDIALGKEDLAFAERMR